MMTNSNANNSGELYHKMILILHTFLYDIKKSIALFLFCIVVVVAILFTYNYKQSKIYKSSFTVSYEELIRKVHGDRLDKLNTLVEKGYVNKVSNLLGIDDKLATTIVGVQGVNIIGQDLVDDLNTDTIPFIVHVYMTDTVGLRAVQEGVVTYLETGNVYLEELAQIKKEEIENEIAFIDKQLSLLDSSKLAIMNNKSVGASNSELLQSIYDVSYDLYEKRQKLIRRKANPSNLHIIDEAIVPVPKGHSYLLLAIIGVVLGKLLYIGVRYLLIPAIKYKQ